MIVASERAHDIAELGLRTLELVVGLLDAGATAWLAWAIITEVQALIRQHKAEGFLTLLQRVQDPAVTSARERVLEAHRKGDTVMTPDQWRPELYQDGQLVARRYDELGILVLKVQSVDVQLVIAVWGPSIRSTWEATVKLVEYQRSKYRDPGRWVHFQKLADLAQESPR